MSSPRLLGLPAGAPTGLQAGRPADVLVGRGAPLSAITDILDRLSGVAVVKERLAETARNVDRSLVWLLDHEKRLIQLEARTPSPDVAPAKRPRLTRK